MNNAVLSGRLGKDPELRKTSSGVSMCSFHLAIRQEPDRDGNEVTDWFPVVCWRQSAEYLCERAEKGDLIAVQGRLKMRSYTRDNMQECTITELNADRVEIISKARKEPSVGFYEPEKNSGTRKNTAAAKKRQQLPTATPEDIARAVYEDTGEMIEADDLPF